MTAESLLELRRRRPFQPFRLVLNDGETHEIREPGRIFVTRDMLAIGTGQGVDGIYDEARIVSPQQVAAVEPLDDRHAPGPGEP